MKMAFIFFFIAISSAAYGQQLTALVKSKVDEHCRLKLNRYKGNIMITDATQDGNTLTVSGTFDYEFKTLIGINHIKNYQFKCRLKVVLDDMVVDNFCYKKLTYYVPGDPPFETCECTFEKYKICP